MNGGWSAACPGSENIKRFLRQLAIPSAKKSLESYVDKIRSSELYMWKSMFR